MALRTPYLRASYDAAATTPRVPPPTTTGLPRRVGSLRISTLAKNASMSTCRIGQPVSSPSVRPDSRGMSALRPIGSAGASPGEYVHPAGDLRERGPLGAGGL